MNALLHDIDTGADNTTHEIVRVFMVIVIAIQIIAFLIGTTMEIRHALMTGQWDLQSYYQATVTFVIGIGTFIIGGATAIKIKQGNEPNPTQAQQVTPASSANLIKDVFSNT